VTVYSVFGRVLLAPPVGGESELNPTQTAVIAGSCLSLVLAGAAPGAETADAASVRTSVAHVGCFDAADPEMRALVLKEIGALPPTYRVPPHARFNVDTFAWRGEATIGITGRAQRAHLTYSFPADGITWGLDEVQTPGKSTGTSDLTARLEATFGAGNADLGREHIRQTLAGWAHLGGLTYREVSDDSSPMTEDTTRSALRGDIRIGGASLGINGVLGYNGFPSPIGEVGTGGGDMFINTSYFDTPTFNNSNNDYLGFRNTVSHEHGHGLGLMHVIPCNGSKLMEPFILTFFQGGQLDDARAIGRMNGDRFTGNNSPGAAVDLGNLSVPILHSVVADRLSVNGASGFGNTDEDYFRFRTDDVEDIVVTATPTGGTYENGAQSFGCVIEDSDIVNADSAGNLRLELRDSAGTTTLFSSNTAGPGAPEVMSLPALPAGEYVVLVKDVGPNPSINQVVQLYDLSVSPGDLPTPPVVVAGVDKRIEAGENCFFIGDINSYATAPDAFMNPATFAWDLDGDGAFEVAGDPRPMTQYVSNGDYTITLRAFDTNGFSDEDTFLLTVFGAQTAVDAIAPSSAAPGATVPVVITGENLRSVTSASEITVSGGGIAVIGTPVPNAMGDQIDGLSFVIDPGAAGTLRNVTIDAGDGAGVGLGVFQVSGASNPADLDGDGIVDSSDLAFLLAFWGPCVGCEADLDGSGEVDSSDLAIVLAAWD